MSSIAIGIRKLLPSSPSKKKRNAAMNNSNTTKSNNDGGGNSSNDSNSNNKQSSSPQQQNQKQSPPPAPPQPITHAYALSLLPTYLHPLVRHYHDDFYVSRSFDPRLIVQLMSEGFLPIATRGYLLPKLHAERCVLRLNTYDDDDDSNNNNDNNPTNDRNSNNSTVTNNNDRGKSKLHISKSVRKKSKRFELSINECFDDVVAGCHKQHGQNWLYPPIVNAFRAIYQRTVENTPATNGGGIGGGGVNAMIMSNTNNNNSNSNNSKNNSDYGYNEQQQQLTPTDITPVRLYSVEIWNTTTNTLVGGELGYSVGAIYTSLTGFSNEETAGSVQLVALGQLLKECGFDYWDLGMDLEYKRRLGAEMMTREEFVQVVQKSRVEKKGVVLRLCRGKKVQQSYGMVVREGAKELIDWDLSDHQHTMVKSSVLVAGSAKVDGESKQNDLDDNRNDQHPNQAKEAIHNGPKKLTKKEKKLLKLQKKKEQKKQQKQQQKQQQCEASSSSDPKNNSNINTKNHDQTVHHKALLPPDDQDHHNRKRAHDKEDEMDER